MYNLNKKSARVVSILQERENIQIVSLQLDKQNKAKGVNYPDLTDRLKSGDKVVVNTTAVDLKLGTGGYHFVINKIKEDNIKDFKTDYKDCQTDPKAGHIMKLRYTPLQMRTLSVEENASPYHD